MHVNSWPVASGSCMHEPPSMTICQKGMLLDKDSCLRQAGAVAGMWMGLALLAAALALPLTRPQALQTGGPPRCGSTKGGVGFFGFTGF
jgi:hypothetical protein